MKQSISSRCRRNALLISTILAVVLGIILGISLRYLNPSALVVRLASFPGEIFMNVLKLIILPLVIASLIAALSQMDVSKSAKLAFWACLYYASTTFLAVLLGIALVLIIHPGDPSIKRSSATMDDQVVDENAVDTLTTFLDLIRNLFPENLFQATMQQVQTKIVATSKLAFNETSNSSSLTIGESTELTYANSPNMLGIIAISITFGMVCAKLGSEVRAIIDLFVALDVVIVKIISLFMWYSPIGIMSLITGSLLQIDDIGKTVQSIGWYVITVMIGLGIHFTITLPVIFYAVTKKNPFTFLRGMLQAMLTALGTSSSAATLPVSFKCLEEKNEVDVRVTRFVLPIGATINMDGTALYEAVASIFIAQMNGISLSIGQVILISLTATLASIGAASVPSAGLVTMIIVLSTVGLPIKDISMIISVDWFLDRFRTCTNVMGDAYGAGIVEHLCRKDLLCPKVSFASNGGSECARGSHVVKDNNNVQITNQESV